MISKSETERGSERSCRINTSLRWEDQKSIQPWFRCWNVHSQKGIILRGDIEFYEGSGIAHWLERRTRDWKVASSNPCGSGGRGFFSGVNFLCWLVFRYPFHPRVTAVAHKRSRSFCQKCRWQVTAKHANTLPMWLWMKWHCILVHGWMVYTEPVPKRQHFTWHQPCNIHRALPVYHFRGY